MTKQTIAYVQTPSGTIAVTGDSDTEVSGDVRQRIALLLSVDPEDISETPPDEGEPPVVREVPLPEPDGLVPPSAKVEPMTQEPAVAGVQPPDADEKQGPTKPVAVKPLDAAIPGTTPSRASVLGLATASQAVRNLYQDVLDAVPTAPRVKREEPPAPESYDDYLPKLGAQGGSSAKKRREY